MDCEVVFSYTCRLTSNLKMQISMVAIQFCTFSVC